MYTVEFKSNIYANLRNVMLFYNIYNMQHLSQIYNVGEGWFGRIHMTGKAFTLVVWD